jgi:hypothetical protein
MSGFRVCKKRCDQCLFSSAKVVGDDRKLDILRDCVKEDAHFICHKFTLAEGPGSQVCCRGFYDANPAATNLMRIAGRLGAVEFVELPAPATPPSSGGK